VAICGGTSEKPNKHLPGTVEVAEDALRVAGAADVLALVVNLAEDAQVERFAMPSWRSSADATSSSISDLAPQRVGQRRYQLPRGFPEVPVSRWQAVMHVNITAAVILSQRFLPGMIEHGSGVVMTVGSACP
jgi:NAD(P)-dependent dehydrogenase (short-subunit alcohol dehydrogenase family)